MKKLWYIDTDTHQIWNNKEVQSWNYTVYLWQNPESMGIDRVDVAYDAPYSLPKYVKQSIKDLYMSA